MRTKGKGTERPQGGKQYSSFMWGGIMPPREENADLPEFTPERLRLLLQGVYGDFLHHNNSLRLEGGIADNDLWQRRWRQFTDMSSSWYNTPSRSAGRRFTAILDVEWQVVLGRSWNSERPLVFAHVVLTKTLGIRRAQEIRARITRWMDLWERGLHAGMVGYSEAKGADKEDRAASGGEEE